MKHHRFYSAIPIVDCTVPVTIPSLELMSQLKRVLRFHEGDEVVLFDNSGREYRAAIYKYHKDSVSFVVNHIEAKHVSLPETWLFASLVKKDTFEWITEKATELGVSHIVPVISARTEKKDINLERLIKVSIEASEQSGRVTIPQIHSPLKLAECVATYSIHNAIAWEPSAIKFKHEELVDILGIYIGPEGGWIPEELELFKQQGIMLRSLGHQVLRAETAVVSALSLVVL